MKKSLFIISFLCLFQASFCQDTEWRYVRIDSFLSVSLPGNFISFDTVLVKKGKSFSTRVFKTSTKFSHLGVTVTQTDLNINPYDYRSMKEAYEGVKYGFMRNAESQGFSVDMKDTIVNSVQGFKADVFTDDSRTLINRINYLFCVNSITYSIVAAPVENKTAEFNEDLEKLVQSIRFNKKEILRSAPANDNDELSSSFEKGQKLGELLGPILLVVGIVIFFVYKSRKGK